MKPTNRDVVELAMCNIELISHLIGKCEDLHDIDPQELSYSLSSSLRLIKDNSRSLSEVCL